VLIDLVLYTVTVDIFYETFVVESSHGNVTIQTLKIGCHIITLVA